MVVNARGERDRVVAGNIKGFVSSSLLYLKRSSRGRYIKGGSDSFHCPVREETPASHYFTFHHLRMKDLS